MDLLDSKESGPLKDCDSSVAYLDETQSLALNILTSMAHDD
jgi:hypothetical protein